MALHWCLLLLSLCWQAAAWSIIGCSFEDLNAAPTVNASDPTISASLSDMQNSRIKSNVLNSFGARCTRAGMYFQVCSPWHKKSLVCVSKAIAKNVTLYPPNICEQILRKCIFIRDDAPHTQQGAAPLSMPKTTNISSLLQNETNYDTTSVTTNGTVGQQADPQPATVLNDTKSDNSTSSSSSRGIARDKCATLQVAYRNTDVVGDGPRLHVVLSANKRVTSLLHTQRFIDFFGQHFQHVKIMGMKQWVAEACTTVSESNTNTTVAAEKRKSRTTTTTALASAGPVPLMRECTVAVPTLFVVSLPHLRREIDTIPENAAILAAGGEKCTARVPPRAGPIFRQYYCESQFSSDPRLRYVPLGPRWEFLKRPQAQLRRSKDRRLLFNLVIALTSLERRELSAELVHFAERYPPSMTYIHIIQQWSSNIMTGGYLNSSFYATVMEDSMFTLCPVGHHTEQFRIYEAIECGSIPVIIAPEARLREELSSEFWNSPLIIGNSTAAVMEAMAALVQDPAALDKRQHSAYKWYHMFITRSLAAILDNVNERFKPSSN